MKEEKIKEIEEAIAQLANNARGGEDHYTLHVVMGSSKVEYKIIPRRGKTVEGSITF